MNTTTKLNFGATVLAKATKYGVSAKTFANRTQAEKAAMECGGEAIRPNGGRVWYVLVEALA